MEQECVWELREQQKSQSRQTGMSQGESWRKEGQRVNKGLAVHCKDFGFYYELNEESIEF